MRKIPRLPERIHFRMRPSGSIMKTGANAPPLLNKDGSHWWVRAAKTQSPLPKPQSKPHPSEVLRGKQGGHQENSPST